MIIAHLRWQSQRRGIQIQFVFGDVDRTVEKIFFHRLKSSKHDLRGPGWNLYLVCELKGEVR